MLGEYVTKVTCQGLRDPGGGFKGPDGFLRVPKWVSGVLEDVLEVLGKL